MGTVVSLLATGFLRGPIKQLKSMFEPKRLIAVCVMVVMIVMTFVSAFVLKSGILCIVFCVLQFLSYCWYCISYIPFARETVMGCCKSCTGMS